MIDGLSGRLNKLQLRDELADISANVAGTYEVEVMCVCGWKC